MNQDDDFDIVTGDPDEIEATDLADSGYRKTISDCHQDDCEGTLWYDEHTLVCETCLMSVDIDQQRRTTDVDSVPQKWDTFWSDREERHTYYGSGHVQMVGGFIEAYDWVTSDDIDGTVSNVSADDFYR